LRDYLSEVNEEMILFDGYDDALMGYIHRKGIPPVALYNFDKCVEILMERDGMSYEESVEWMDFNVLDAYVGKNTPAFAVLL
jgi:hypothetical protein